MMTKDVTGRDGYIMRKALAYAITAIDALPQEWQEESDRKDMADLLNAYTEGASLYFFNEARVHLGQGK